MTPYPTRDSYWGKFSPTYCPAISTDEGNPSAGAREEMHSSDHGLPEVRCRADGRWVDFRTTDRKYWFPLGSG